MEQLKNPSLNTLIKMKTGQIGTGREIRQRAVRIINLKM